MKKNIYLFLTIVIALTACNQNTITEQDAAAKTFPEKAASLTIYEVNIRQHTAEGTINAFIKVGKALAVIPKN